MHPSDCLAKLAPSRCLKRWPSLKDRSLSRDKSLIDSNLVASHLAPLTMRSDPLRIQWIHKEASGDWRGNCERARSISTALPSIRKQRRSARLPAVSKQLHWPPDSKRICPFKTKESVRSTRPPSPGIGLHWDPLKSRVCPLGTEDVR